MYGNTPLGRNPATTPAGQRASTDTITLTSDEKARFRQDLRHLETTIEQHLPGVYETSSGVIKTQAGIQGIVTVQLPVGKTVGANITPPMDDGALADIEGHEEFVKDVVATAVAVTIDETDGEPPRVAR